MIYFFSWSLKNSIPLNKIAELGNSFNILTSIATNLTLVGLIWSIVIQKEELKAVTSEMEGQKKK